MTNSTKVLVFIFIILVGVGGFFYYQKNVTPPGEPSVLTTQQASIRGCYVSHLAKDVYSLNIKTQDEDMFTGTLSFKNFEKDSSSGTYKGTYENGVLLGDYSFASEGMNSVRQVIFKKVGANFVAGYGPMNAAGDHFADLNNITYDPNQTFIPSATCPS